MSYKWIFVYNTAKIDRLDFWIVPHHPEEKSGQIKGVDELA